MSIYNIGRVDNFFTGVIDETSFYDFGISAHDALSIYSITQTATPPGSLFLFDGGAADAAGFSSGTVSGATLSADRFGSANQAFFFDGIDDLITVPTPFKAADDDFTITVWLQPTLLNDGAWHGFIGYQSDCTRSPSLWVNFNGCDVGFCDCSGTTGGIEGWSGCDGPNGWCTPEPTFDMPDGQCVADDQIIQACTTANCCDCKTANSGNSGDVVSGNGMHWDTRTTQAVNGAFSNPIKRMKARSYTAV
jgi:hypothetical protein